MCFCPFLLTDGTVSNDHALSVPRKSMLNAIRRRARCRSEGRCGSPGPEKINPVCRAAARCWFSDTGILSHPGPAFLFAGRAGKKERDFYSGLLRKRSLRPVCRTHIRPVYPRFFIMANTFVSKLGDKILKIKTNFSVREAPVGNQRNVLMVSAPGKILRARPPSRNGTLFTSVTSMSYIRWNRCVWLIGSCSPAKNGSCKIVWPRPAR